MSVLAANFQLIYQGKQQPQKLSGGRRLLLEKPHVYGYGVSNQQWMIGKRGSRGVRQAAAFWEDTSRGGNVVDLEEIKDCEQLDQILLQAKDYSQPILIDWMAAWCRKCIFLKPKLEKLAAEYGTKLRFYCVDVNSVPQALVKRGNISKMPTIQLWKDGELKAEVIGGHKAWLVVDEVREMIQKFV